MLITKREVKQTSKKLLSVLLAVIMIMTSMSVCFGTSVFAAGKDADVTALANALKFESIKNASFSGSANNYTVNDPDGKILSAIEAYFAVVDSMANKTPTNEKPSSGTSNIAQKGESSDKTYRTYNHLNARVKTLLQSKMGSDYTAYNVDKFITGLLAGSTVTEGTTQKTVGPDGSSNTTVPSSPLADAPSVKLTVNSESAVTGYTLADLPDNVATTKTFSVSHAKTNYDYKFTYTPATESCGNSNNDQKYTHDYYFYYNYSSYSVTDGASVSTQSIKTAASTFSTYADYFNMDLGTLVAKGNTTLGTVKTAVNNAKSNVVSAFSEGVFTHFFGTTYNVAALNTNIDNAIAVNNYIGIAREIVNLTAENFTGYSYDQLNSLYSTLQQKINNYKPNNTTADAYIVAQTGLNLTTSNARLTAINKEMQLIKIREAKPVIDSHMATFNAYTNEQIDEGTLTTGMIASALTTIKSDKTKLEGFTRSYVDEVCGSDYFSKINNCIAHLNSLATTANYNDRFSAKWAEFIGGIEAAIAPTLSADELYTGITENDGWYTELKALVNEMKSVLGEDLATALFDDHDTYISGLMDAAYDALNAKVKTQVDDAYVLFKAFIDTYPDGAIDFKNVSQFSAMKYSIGLINVDAYNFLRNASNVTVAQDTINKYNELQRTFPDFDAFIKSMGFSEFETTDIEDIVRPDTIEDVARKNKDGKYIVDDKKVESVIGKLDALLNNPEIKTLLGSLILKDEDGNPTGEALDLGGLLKGLIKDALFTDGMINTIIGMLYPLVVTEFAKVWANELPSTFKLDEIVIFDAGFLGKVKVPGQTPAINYDKNLYTVLKESPFNVFPDLLANDLEKLDSSKYASNISLLRKASSQFNSEFGGTGNTYYTLVNDPDGGTKADGSPRQIADKTPWDSSALKRNVIDEETGEVKLDGDGNPVKEWALDWGVDAAREKMENGEMTEVEFENFFYQAFDDAVEGLKPLLYALIANASWTNTDVTDMASLVIKDITLIGDTDVTVDLDLSATANRGYANLLVPIYEVIGTTFTAPATVEAYSGNANGAALILKAILDPIFAFVDKLGKNPLDTLLGILPDICYVLATQSVPKLLGMLKTTITYFGKPIGTGIPIIGELDLTTVSDKAKVEGGANINVGEMLDLKDMGVDLTDGINSVLAGFGMDLPDLDQGKLATLGEKTTIDTQRSEWIYEKPADGKAYHIEANKADVLLYILDWALGNLNTLLSTFGVDAGSAGELLATLSENPDLAIAVVAEMLTLGKYDTLRNYEWFEGKVDGESVVGNSAYEIYLNPNNDWTKEKATYLYNNIDALVASILAMAGLDLNEETPEVDGSLGEVIGGAIGGLLSDKTLTSLAALLAKLDLNALLAPKAEEGENADAPETVAEGEESEAALALDVNALVKDLLGIDLSQFAVKYGEIAEKVEAAKDSETPYVHDFGVDKGEKTFAKALTEMLAPLNDVLAFILKGGDLRIDLGAEGKDEKDIVLPGYDGYNNALIPLLEALGCDVPASADVTNALETVLNALVARIDSLTKGNVIKNIIDILPGVFYFIASKGLSVSVRNLLQPVYVILDTIRPIVDVNLNELIAGLLPEDSGIMLNIDDIGLEFIFDLLATLVPELDLSELKDVIYDICYNVGTDYSKTAKSTLQKTWKKGAYSADFDQADLLTVVLSFVLEWATVEDNAKALDELLNTNGIISSLNKVFEDVKIEYGTPNWMYWFDSEEEFNEYLAGDTNLPNTLAALDWSSVEENVWNLETAQYFAENIDELVDLIIGMINKDKVDEEGNALPTNLKDLLGGLVNGLVNAETINELVAMITDLLGDIDENLINTAGYLLDIDLAGLKAYSCTAEINSISDFINELANVLDKYADGLVNWLFFGDDYRFAKKSDKTDTIVINGGLGYEKGLAMILEALGCELPKEANTKSVLGALATRVEEILANPIDEVLELLPNLIYFLNANGAGVAVDNLLQPVYALLDKLSAFGLNVNLADLLKITKEDGTVIEIDLENLSLENVVTIVEGATDLPLDAAEKILVNFCTGKITKGEYIYRMDAAKEDVITILLVVACELIYDDAFAAKLDEMLGTNFIAQLKNIFSGSEIIYKYPEWNYMDGKEKDGVIEYVNAIASYPNDWTEAKAEYLTENLPALVDTVISMVEINGVKYDSLAALLQANVNIFTTETLNSLLDLIKNLLGNIDAELLEVGFIIDVDLNGLMAYEVPDDVDTVKEFADVLATVLSDYAKGAVEWLLLGRNFNLLVKDADGIDSELVTEGSYIELNGAHGYAEGLALLLEALGCEDLPAVYDVENLDTKAVVKKVLASLAERVEAILANPVEEVLELLPNLIYFLDADGVEAVITNTTAALTALVSKLSVLGVELDINSLVNLPELMGIADKYAEGDDVISLDNLTLKALLKAVSLMTELDLTELENVLVPFALGEAVKYDSVSETDAYKMVYRDELDKHDMISVIVTAALRLAVENEENAAKLDEMLGTEIISALKKVFEGVDITYATPEWKYPLSEDGVTVDAMKYSITYPNNWTEATAKYVTDKLPEIGDLIAGLIDSNYDSLSALLKANVNVFTSENLQSIVDLIANLLKDIDDGLLDAAGVLLGADVVGLKKYEAPKDIDTVEEFAAELANVLNTYAKGVVEWLLLGNDYKFFVKEVKNGVPVDFITINGANGYSEGLALLLEALGCENLPAADAATEEIVTGVLTSMAALINKVLNNPVETVIEILPNVLYFLNANGVSAVVDNTLAAVTALLKKLEVFGVNINIDELVNIAALMGLEDTEASISLDNLSMAAILEAVGLMVGLDLTLIEDVLVGFALGEVNKYESVSASAAYKMSYKDEFDKHDMVTVLVNLVLLTIVDENNAEFVKGLVGDAAYEVILNLCNGIAPVEIQEFDWKFTDKADTEEVFSAIDASELYQGYGYGPLYTKEMAEYIADNFGTFVDNIIYLLGLEINGITVDNLTDLINGLLNGSLYNSSNVIAIRDALAGALEGIAGLEVNGKNVGKYIVEVLANSEVADIAAIAKVEVPEFTEDRAKFVESLCAVLEPLYPVLKWVLADEDIAFFTDLEKEDLIKLEGAEGYAYGIIPLLETLECKDVLAPEAYYAAVEADGSVLLTSILNPLLNRVDEIVADDPASAILAMLPNIVYFINSNGVDTVVKNTLNAVYTLLSAIKPIAEVDLYEVIGFDLSTLTFEKLFDMLLDIIGDATGYRFENLKVDAVTELTVGTLESYTSLNTKTAYRMVYNEEASKADMVTVVLRLLVTFIMHENNRELLIGLLKDNLGMSEDAEGYLSGVLESIASLATDTYLGMDQALAVIYYLFYSADIGSAELAGGIKDINAEWKNILKELSRSENPDEITIGDFIGNFLDKYLDDVFTSDGFAPNGLIAFFKKIVDWFNKIIEWFKTFMG